jgi:hypothetical protein
MTGPEHYREAEALAESSLHWMGGDWGPEDMTPAERLARKDSDVAMAQVHATLALAAATALIDEKPRSGSFDAWREWKQVTGGADYPAVTA